MRGVIGAEPAAHTSPVADEASTHPAVAALDGFAPDGTPRWALVSGGRPAKRAYVFVGGLQRSGTTLVEAWLAYAPAATVSFLSEKHVAPDRYEALAPWRIHNHTREYFEVVIASGGLEGKFVQDVYAYRNLFYEMGLRGERAVRELALGAADVPRAEAERTAARARLLAQWRIYWSQSRLAAASPPAEFGGGAAGAASVEGGAQVAAPRTPHYHLEKSPENVLVAPFLRALLWPLPTRFVFTARHPLVWALATEKWVRDEFVQMRKVGERIRGWLAAMEHAQAHALRPGGLPSAAAVAVETFAAFPAVQAELLASTLGLDAARACARAGGAFAAAHGGAGESAAAGFGGALARQAGTGGAGGASAAGGAEGVGESAQGTAAPADAQVPAPASMGLPARAPSACEPMAGFIAHSYGYAACWLHGTSLELTGERRRLLRCAQGVDGVISAGRARRRQAELAELAAQLEGRIAKFGYSFAPFLAVRAGAYWRPAEALVARGPWADVLVGVSPGAIAGSMPPGWIGAPPRPALPSPDGAPRAPLGGGGLPGDGGRPAPHVLVAYELPLSNFSSSTSHSGMNQRFLQVVGSLRALGCAVHLVSFHSSPPPPAGMPLGAAAPGAAGAPLRSAMEASAKEAAAAASALLPAQLRLPAVTSYAGSFEEQVSAALLVAAGRLTHALVFCTHITQNLHRQAERDDARDAADAEFNSNELYAKSHPAERRTSDEPPPLALPVERALHWARAALPRAAVAIVTDDIHHTRVQTVLQPHAAVDLPRLTRWLRRREGALYAGASIAFAVSPEDAARIAAGFADGAGGGGAGAGGGEGAAAAAGGGERRGAHARVHLGQPIGAEVATAPPRIVSALAAGGRQARAALRTLTDACARDSQCLGVRLGGGCIRFRLTMHVGAHLALLPAVGDSEEGARLVFSKRRSTGGQPASVGSASLNGSALRSAARDGAAHGGADGGEQMQSSFWGGAFAPARAVRAVPFPSQAEARAAELAHCAGTAALLPDDTEAARARVGSAHEALLACARDERCAGVSVDTVLDSASLGVSAGSGHGQGGGAAWEAGKAAGLASACEAALLRAPAPPPASGRLRWSHDAAHVTIERAARVHTRWLPFILDARAARAAAAVGEAGARWVAGRRVGLFYVGQPHPLSIAAVGWLCARVLPLLAALGARAGERAHLRLAGAQWEAKALPQSPELSAALSLGHVTLLGELTDDELEAEFLAARVFAAPLINATGIATKNVHALARGLPTVSGADGARGLGFGGREHAARVMHLSDDPAEFAKHCRVLIEDDARWAAFAAAGAAHVRDTLSAGRLDALLGEFLRGEAGVDDVLEFYHEPKLRLGVSR